MRLKITLSQLKTVLIDYQQEPKYPMTIVLKDMDKEELKELTDYLSWYNKNKPIAKFSKADLKIKAGGMLPNC